MKYIAMLALAAVSMSAFAQDMDKKKDWSADMNMKHGLWLDKSISEQPMMDVKKAVKWHAKDYMLAGDAEVLKAAMDRAPSNEVWALTNGLASVLQQSLILQTGFNSFETNSTGNQLKAIIGMNKALGPDTYAILENPQPMAMEGQSRAQRFVTWNGAPSVSADYKSVLMSLTSNLNDTQAATLRDWFWNTSERNRDAVSRFVQSAINVHALNYKSALRGNAEW
ncbi:hypothetical protein EON81_08745 [bacterium]|nr:MAG: hypothetical protein EON81_08745 [bacterium]